LATPDMFFNLPRQAICDALLCFAAKAMYQSGCFEEYYEFIEDLPGLADCLAAAQDVMSLYCAMLGIPYPKRKQQYCTLPWSIPVRLPGIPLPFRIPIVLPWPYLW
jgi:hypothetical protein